MNAVESSEPRSIKINENIEHLYMHLVHSLLQLGGIHTMRGLGL